MSFQKGLKERGYPCELTEPKSDFFINGPGQVTDFGFVFLVKTAAGIFSLQVLFYFLNFAPSAESFMTNIYFKYTTVHVK